MAKTIIPPLNLIEVYRGPKHLESRNHFLRTRVRQAVSFYLNCNRVGYISIIWASCLAPSRFDYEQKYPEDASGEEAGDYARVWLTYLDETEQYDRDKIDGWKDTIDVLMVLV